MKHPLLSKSEFKLIETVKVHEEHIWKSCFEVGQSWTGLGWSKGLSVVLEMMVFFTEDAFSRVLAYLGLEHWPQRRQSHEEDTVKISRAVGFVCCHAVRIQQLGETTEQHKFLSPSPWLMCAALSCQSFLLSLSGRAVTYLEENWGFALV